MTQGRGPRIPPSRYKGKRANELTWDKLREERRREAEPPEADPEVCMFCGQPGDDVDPLDADGNGHRGLSHAGCLSDWLNIEYEDRWEA